MASTITAATLTVTITEAVTLNGYDQGSSNSLTISSVNEVTKRIVTCPASNTTTLVTFKADVYDAAGAMNLADTKYIRITNKDDTNALELAIVGAAKNYQVELAAGESHILGGPDNVFDAEADNDPAFGTMLDIVTIQVNPGGNTIDVELFAASA